MPTPRFSIRVDPAELKRWKKAAKAEGLDVSAWIRSRCAVPAPKPKRKPVTDEMLDEIATAPRLRSAADKAVSRICPPHPKGARQAVNAELGLFRCGACGEIVS